MFGIGWGEILLIAVVGIFAIGPKEMPRALYSAGKFLRKIRMFSSDIQKSLDRILEEEALDEIIREANKPGGERLQQEAERQYAEERARKQAAEESPHGG